MSEFKVEDKVIPTVSIKGYCLEIVFIYKDWALCIWNDVLPANAASITKSPTLFHISNLRPYNPLKVGDVVEVKKKDSGRRIQEITKIEGLTFWGTNAFTEEEKPLSPIPYTYSPDTVKLLYRPEE